MNTDTLLRLSDLITRAAHRAPDAIALRSSAGELTYAELHSAVAGLASGLIKLGLARQDRVAIYLDKRFETVIACFGASAAGGAFVPINPLLKPEQVAHILLDSGARYLVTSADRAQLLETSLTRCAELQHIVLIDTPESGIACATGRTVHRWHDLLDATAKPFHRVIERDMTAILYTSGSTGHPKGVVVSHRNLLAGATSVAGYLENTNNDTLLAALPLSFDAGFSQLTTAFSVGAKVVLLNYLLPRDVLKAFEREKITGITAVPPLYIQLAELDWPEDAGQHLRYFANTGGHLPLDTLGKLRQRVPKAKPYLMYGLTEAFRSSYLDPSEIDRRPGSMGKAIPNAELLVLRDDGTLCDDNEPGELVHRGPLVSLGYWKDKTKTEERFKPLPAGLGSAADGATLAEIAVFSGDTVRRDEDGFLYFIGRRDGMIKTSGYRVSPTEVEEVLYATQSISECIAFGVAHPRLGQAIRVIAVAKESLSITPSSLLAECRQRMPAYMVPQGIELRNAPLPRNPNGKIDRNALIAAHGDTNKP